MTLFTNDVTYKNTPLTVITDYTPGEPPTYDYPGMPEQIDITNVLVGDVDITELLTEQQLEDLVRTLKEPAKQPLNFEPDDIPY